MWRAITGTMALWGWKLWVSLPKCVGSRLMPGYEKALERCMHVICYPESWKLTEWRILPTGCEWPDDVCRSFLETYAVERRESSRKTAESPFEIPPVPEEMRAEVTECERRCRKHNIECVDEDIATKEAEIQALRQFDKRMWKLLTARLWRMSTCGCSLDWFLFRPGKSGRGRTVELNMFGREYVLHLDFLENATECRLEFIKEVPIPESFELPRFRRE